jgi:hypothetical protein
MREPDFISVSFVGSSCLFCGERTASTTAPLVLTRKRKALASVLRDTARVDAPACAPCRRLHDSVTGAASARKTAGADAEPPPQVEAAAYGVTLAALGGGVGVLVLTGNGWLALLVALALLASGIYLGVRVGRRLEPEPDPARRDALQYLEADRKDWRRWVARCRQAGRSDEFRRLRRAGWRVEYSLFPRS